MDGSIAGVYLPDRRTRWSRPLIMSRVPAGFPSPAEDYVEGRIDLNRDLIKHPLSTFYIRVSGDSMIGAGIMPGALLVVDRGVDVYDGHVVVARIVLWVLRIPVPEMEKILVIAFVSAIGVTMLLQVDFGVLLRKEASSNIPLRRLFRDKNFISSVMLASLSASLFCAAMIMTVMA